MKQPRLGLILALAIGCTLLISVPAFADSQVRIVRLSTVDGDVQIDRNVGEGYEKALANLPITQGVKLRANRDGRAEVEFEDGSTIRIVPGTEIDFPQLSLRDSGAKVTAVNLLEGTAYVDFAGEKSDEFTVSFGRETARLAGSAHFRLEMDKSSAALAVFKGKVMVEAPSGNVEVSKKQTASFDFADSDRLTLARNVEEAPFDQWDKRQDEYHDNYLARNNYGSPYAYGVSDLNYYGSFFSVPGYGMVWQPYFTGVGWDPFMNGAWCWYPGFGYMWVSSYPWGWMPFRYGSWIFASPYGWVWQPGGFGAGWNRVPRLVNAPSRFTMPQAPTGPGRTTMVVNRNSFVPTRGPSTNRMVIRNDSAGLGIPRGALRNPARISREVSQQGSVTTRIQTPAARATPTPVPTTGPHPAPRPSTPTSTPSSGGSGSRMGSAPSMPRSAPAPRSAPSPRSTPR